MKKTPNNRPKYLAALLAIVFVVITLLLFATLTVYAYTGERGFIYNYLFSSALIALFLAAIFVSGNLLLKKHKLWGRRLLIAGSFLFLLAFVLPLRSFYAFAIGWQGITLTTLIAILIAAPFIYLIVYLWKNHTH